MYKKVYVCIRNIESKSEILGCKFNIYKAFSLCNNTALKNEDTSERLEMEKSDFPDEQKWFSNALVDGSIYYEIQMFLVEDLD